MIKYNKDSGKYFVKGKGENVEEKEAQKYYDDNLSKLFKDVIKVENIDCIKKIEEDDKYINFEGKYMIQKMFVLESMFNVDQNYKLKDSLLHIYKKEALDFAYDQLIGKNNNDEIIGRTTKNNAICEKCYKILKKDKNRENTYIISRILWDLYNAQSLATKEQPNVIFYGAPGTGKTYEVKKALNILKITKGIEYRIVQCHPNFGYEDFIEGYKPVGITSNGNIKLEIVNGVFKNFCIEAQNHLEKEYYFVCDEINRANLSAMFGESLSLIESSYRDDPKGKRNLVSTPLSEAIKKQIDNKYLEKNVAYYYDDKEVKFGIPHNVRFIGMMNDVDKSIDSFDLALRRRFKWIRKDCDYEVIKKELIKSKKEDSEDYIKRCKNLNEFISKKGKDCLGFGKTYEFGHAYYLRIVDINKRGKISKISLETLFEEHLEPVLREYIRSFKDEDEIDDVLEKARNIFVEDKQ